MKFFKKSNFALVLSIMSIGIADPVWAETKSNQIQNLYLIEIAKLASQAGGSRVLLPTMEDWNMVKSNSEASFILHRTIQAVQKGQLPQEVFLLAAIDPNDFVLTNSLADIDPELGARLSKIDPRQDLQDINNPTISGPQIEVTVGPDGRPSVQNVTSDRGSSIRDALRSGFTLGFLDGPSTTSPEIAADGLQSFNPYVKSEGFLDKQGIVEGQSLRQTGSAIGQGVSNAAKTVADFTKDSASTFVTAVSDTGNALTAAWKAFKITDLVESAPKPAPAPSSPPSPPSNPEVATATPPPPPPPPPPGTGASSQDPNKFRVELTSAQKAILDAKLKAADTGFVNLGPNSRNGGGGITAQSQVQSTEDPNNTSSSRRRRSTAEQKAQAFQYGWSGSGNYTTRFGGMDGGDTNSQLLQAPQPVSSAEIKRLQQETCGQSGHPPCR